MSWRIALIFLLAWCNAASAQADLPHPQGTAPRQNPQVRPPRSVPGTTSLPAKTGRSEPSITPRRETAFADRASTPTGGSSSPWKMLGALMLAVGGIFGVAKLLKSLGVGPYGPARQLPNSVCEVLGVTMLPQRQTLYLLRMGQRVMLLGSTSESLTVLAEITEPDEVASMMHLCNSPDKSEPDSQSFFSRLLNHASSPERTSNPPASKDSNARRELEAKLNAFAQS